MDFTEKSSEQQLLSEMKRLKERIKQMEELYSEEDEKKYQQIQALKQQKRELEEKVENLQTKLYNVEFNLSMSSSCSSPLNDSTVYEHDTTVDTSFTTNSNFDDSMLSLSEDFAILQDSFHSLSDEKSELETKNDKLNAKNDELQQIIEDLCFKNYTQQEMIQKVKSMNFELCKENQDLYKTVCRLQMEIEELQSCKNLNETQMSLFDELEDVKKKEEKFQQDSIPEIIVIENKNTFKVLAKESFKSYEFGELQIIKKKRKSFFKTSLSRLVSLLSVCFDYLAAGVQLELIFPVPLSDVCFFQNQPSFP
uniref:Uncharacterized protein n=1 Tax=Panagrolaimus sp. ES5 TaxID=591445 RepID=A0AC34F1V4_9BILA